MSERQRGGYPAEQRRGRAARDAAQERSSGAGETEPRRARGQVGVPRGTPTGRTASTARRRATEIFSIDTPPPTVERFAARRSRVRLHAHRRDRPLPAHARARGLLPDGVGRQRRSPPSGGCRTTSACAAIRRCRTTPTFDAAGEAGEAGDPDQPAELRRALRPARGRGRAEVRGAVAPRSGLSVDWAMTYTTIGDRSRRGVAARVPAQRSPAARRTSRRRPRSGTSTSAPRSRRPSSRTASCPARTTRCAFHGIDGDADIVIETTRPELIPACVALVAHPDDERYRHRFGTRGDARRCSACRCRCSRTRSPIPRRGRASR